MVKFAPGMILVTDYDGTLAEHGRVAPPTVAALERLRTSGRRAVLVTGRQLEDLQTVFPRLNLFDCAVVENGAVLFRPDGGTIELLAEPTPASFVQALAAREVNPLAVGRVIVATLLPHLAAVCDTLREQGLPLHVIFNKDAVMILPPGIDKGSGSRAALDRMERSPRQAIAIGDAENDLPMLRACGMAVAVNDAIDEVKEAADLVTVGGAGAGVVEVIEMMLAATD